MACWVIDFAWLRFQGSWGLGLVWSSRVEAQGSRLHASRIKKLHQHPKLQKARRRLGRRHVESRAAERNGSRLHSDHPQTPKSSTPPNSGPKPETLNPKPQTLNPEP